MIGRSVSPSTPTPPAGTPPKPCGGGSPTPQPEPVTVAALPAGADPADLIATGHEHALADLVRDARPAAQVVCDHTLDGVDLDGNPARRLAGFRQLLPDTTRVPADQRVDHVLYLAHRLDIDPTVAAAEAAAFNPTLFADRAADRLVDHCHQLAAPARPTDNRPDLQDADDRSTRLDADPAAAMTNRPAAAGRRPEPATTSGGWDAIEVLQARARAAAARRDASIAELRQVMDDQEILAEFGIDLSRLEG